MAHDDDVYDEGRIEALLAMLRDLAQRILELDRSGRLLSNVPELLRRMGDLRSELFHYEVRSTYDSPEVAEHRRLVDEARTTPDFPGPDSLDAEDDEPWRRPRPE
jgi:predicted GNAT superfamily acetyltransferase